MPENEAGLSTVLQGQITDVAIYRAPEVILAEAHKAAVALQDVIKNKKNPVIMNGEQYLEYEDWQTVGRFYGITAKVVGDVAFVQYGSVRGFSASAVALRSDGFELSRASADCLSDEPKWSKKTKYEWRDKDGGGREKVAIGEEDVPLFQLKSMAQTRACAKALRNVLSWVVVLAGYRATPAEELGDLVERGAEPKPAGAGRSAAAAQGSSSGAPAAAAGQPEGATKVKNVTTKDGTNANGPWTKYAIYFEDGRQASTFSKTDGEHAERAQKSGALVIPKIKRDGKFFNLEGFEKWPAKEPAKEEHPNPHQDEPLNGPEKILTIRETKTETRTIWFIQTEKRVLITDKAEHVEDANEARKEGMGLTPRIEVIEGKNRLLAWEETVAMHAAEGAGAPAEEAKAAEPAAGKPAKAPRTRKAPEKK